MQKPTELQVETEKFKVTAENFNSHFSLIDKISRQKISGKDLEDKYNTINQLDLIDTYRTFHPTTAQYILFSRAYSTFTKLDR